MVAELRRDISIEERDISRWTESYRAGVSVAAVTGPRLMVRTFISAERFSSIRPALRREFNMHPVPGNHLKKESSHHQHRSCGCRPICQRIPASLAAPASPSLPPYSLSCPISMNFIEQYILVIILYFAKS